MKPNKQEHKHHHIGYLSYKNLKRRYDEQGRQISRASKEIHELQLFRAGVQTAPLVDRLVYLFTGDTRRF